ncbi:TPA: hypothetical protein ACSPZY_004439 [Aeromonas veronii]
MRSYISFGLGLLILASTCRAAPLEKIVNVSANIVANNSSPRLAILAPRLNFITVYDVPTQRFLSVNIPFSVQSLDGVNHQYDLSLVLLNGRCSTTTPGSYNPLSLVATLDGSEFSLGGPVRSGLWTTSLVGSHVLRVDFPSTLQSPTSQACDGSVGVTATITI